MPTIIFKGFGAGATGTLSTGLITRGLFTPDTSHNCDGVGDLKSFPIQEFALPDTYPSLRRFMNPAIDGDTINAWLYALSIGDNYLRRNTKNLVDNLFVKTAVNEYLDILGSNVGATRPAGVGMSDVAFRRIISETTNKQITTKSLLNILDIYFSNFQTRAYIESANSTFFDLEDADDLIIEIDGTQIYNIIFDNDDFIEIGCATALEVANAITTQIKDLNGEAFAVPYYDVAADPRKVRIVSNTVGSRSSVRILGGKAQNALLFSDFIETDQDYTTEFTIDNYSSNSSITGITTRFTWTDGSSPALSQISAGDYVNVYGTGFDDANKGTFTINKVVNGPVNYAYFEITNNASVTESVLLSTNTDMMFFTPIKRIVGSDLQYANLFELADGSVKIFIPSSTSVVERSPTTGGAYIAEEYVTLTHGFTTFTVGETLIGTTSDAEGVVVTAGNGTTILGNIEGEFEVSETITGEESELSSTILTITEALDDSVLGNYLIDLNAFPITFTSTTLNTPLLQNSQHAVISVNSTEGFPETDGYLLIDMGYDNEEKPIPYHKVLNSQDILLDSSYVFKHTHSEGASITLLTSKEKIIPVGDGSDRGSFMTDIARARNSCVDLINNIKAAGITVNIEVLYPGDTGLGNAGTVNSDKYKVWGE